jgi:hypothetical protein
MSRRIILGFIVLIVIVGGIIWLVRSRKNNTATPVLSVSAYNQTQNIDAASASAVKGDKIVYTLKAENTTDKVIPGYVIAADISQIATKATLLDAQGASFDSANNSLEWNPLDIPANGSIQKQFTVQVNPLANGQSTDVMKVSFNNELDISLQQATVASANPQPTPTTPYKAPKTGPTTDIVFALALLTTAFVFFGRMFGDKLFRRA